MGWFLSVQTAAVGPLVAGPQPAHAVARGRPAASP